MKKIDYTEWISLPSFNSSGNIRIYDKNTLIKSCHKNMTLSFLENLKTKKHNHIVIPDEIFQLNNEEFGSPTYLYTMKDLTEYKKMSSLIGKLSYESIINLVIRMLKTTSEIHKLNLCHGYLGLENILLDSKTLDYKFVSFENGLVDGLVIPRVRKPWRPQNQYNNHLEKYNPNNLKLFSIYDDMDLLNCIYFKLTGKSIYEMTDEILRLNTDSSILKLIMDIQLGKENVKSSSYIIDHLIKYKTQENYLLKK